MSRLSRGLSMSMSMGSTSRGLGLVSLPSMALLDQYFERSMQCVGPGGSGEGETGNEQGDHVDIEHTPPLVSPAPPNPPDHPSTSTSTSPVCLLWPVRGHSTCLFHTRGIEKSAEHISACLRFLARAHDAQIARASPSNVHLSSSLQRLNAAPPPPSHLLPSHDPEDTHGSRAMHIIGGDFSGCDLVPVAEMQGFSFHGCDFSLSKLGQVRMCHFYACDFTNANLESCTLTQTSLDSECTLADIAWHGCRLQAALLPPAMPLPCVYESSVELLPASEQKGLYSAAEATYSLLETAYSTQGNHADEIRMYLARMHVKRYTSPVAHRIILTFLNATCEYGMNPGRFVLIIALVVLAFALAMWPMVIVDNGDSANEQTGALQNAIYMSALAFLHAGFGDVAPRGAARFLCVVEGFVGFFCVGPFLFCLVRIAR